MGVVVIGGHRRVSLGGGVRGNMVETNMVRSTPKQSGGLELTWNMCFSKGTLSLFGFSNGDSSGRVPCWMGGSLVIASRGPFASEPPSNSFWRAFGGGLKNMVKYHSAAVCLIISGCEVDHDMVCRILADQLKGNRV